MGVWAFLVALTATSATVTPGWSEEPAHGAPREAQAPTADELAAAREARFRTVWSAADAPHQAGDYAESERLYKQMLAEFPDAQRAALRVAIAQERQGKSAEALESYDRALAADPQGEWAPVALFYKARFCKEGAREPDARAAIARLRAEHPDSSYVARAAVLEAELDGHSTAAAEAALERELAAAALYDAGMAKSKARADEEALVDLRRVPAEYPGTAAALRALDAEGHILTRNRRFDEAEAAFMRILDVCPDDSPRIMQVARTRLAALAHARGDRLEAIERYLGLMESSPTPKVSENALLQAAGLLFEVIQREVWEGEAGVPISRWEHLRDVLRSLRELEGASEKTVLLADLMEMESWCWTGPAEQAIQAGRAFLDKYEHMRDHRREVATALCFLATQYKHAEYYEECESVARRIIELYPTESEIWPRMDHLARANYDLFECVRIQGDKDQAELIRRALESRFPDSPYLEAIAANEAAGVYDRYAQFYQENQK
jgi:tetratricopeptide (TPR) repeat protein